MTDPCAHVVNIHTLTRPLALDPEPLNLGTEIHHVGLTRFPFDAFDGCGLDDTQARFSPLHNADGSVVPVFYAGENYPVAVAENLWHEADRSNPYIHIDSISGRTVGSVVVRQDLTLGQLFNPGLLRLRLNLDQITHTEAECYERTTAFAQAVYDDQPELDGLVWLSRRSLGYRSYLIWQRDPTSTLLETINYDLFTTPRERDRLDNASRSADVALIPRTI